MIQVQQFPMLCAVAELLIYDTGVLGNQQGLFLAQLIQLPEPPGYDFTAAATELAALTEEEFETYVIGDADDAEALGLSDYTRQVVDWLYTELNTLN